MENTKKQRNPSYKEEEWRFLLAKAQNTLKTVPSDQVVCMQSSKGKLYSLIFADLKATIDAADDMTKRLFAELNTNSDKKIDKLVCMWNNGGIDLPSFALRDRLCKLDRENMTAKMLLQGLNALIVKEIGATMPKEYQKDLANG